MIDADYEPEIKILLIAEKYDPEVIIAADWLTNKYNLDITAFTISLHKYGKNTIANFEQRFPLKELATFMNPVLGKMLIQNSCQLLPGKTYFQS